MFKNPLASHENKAAIKELGAHNRDGKIKVKNKQRELAKKIATKKPERGHEERHWKRMQSEGDRSAEDYR